MSYYPPPPPDNDDHYQQHQHHQPLHHQASNRENIGWNNDNVLPDYSNTHNMSNKYNPYSQNDMHNYYNNNGPPNNSQRHDISHHRGDGGGENTNHNPKRAAKRRVKHDLPGPAGNWFRQKKQQKSAATAAAVKNRKPIINSSALKTNESGGTAMTMLDGEQTTVDREIIKSSSPSLTSPSSSSIAKTKPQHEQLFHDHSSDLHECNAWNFMCITLNRIVPPANLVLQNYTATNAGAAYTTYKSILRNSIPNNYALLHEIHEGKYDTCHLQKELYATDLHVPLLVGYVASVQCHAHSDWTALLVDEMQSVAKYHNGGNCGNGSSNNVGRGVVCWIEERLVKQHANWIRPGVVWLIEGAKLALFSSPDEDDDEMIHHHDNNSTTGSTNAEISSTTTVDMSPSTDNSRGGGSIDRMILVGESSMVYAWTPEEASCTFTHQEFSDLMERRCDLGLRGEEDEGLRDEDKMKMEEVEKKEVIECDDDCMTSKSDVRTSKDGSADNNNDDDDEASIVEKTNVESVEIIDIDVMTAENAPEASEQVLEACLDANDNDVTHKQSQNECAGRPQVANDEPKVRPPVKNLSNPYAKKTLSQVTPHDEVTTNSTVVGGVSKEGNVMNSSVLVQPKVSSVSPMKAKVQDDMTEKKGLTIDNAQNPQTQPIANRPDQQIQVDMDDTFDDMLDENSLDEMLPHGKPDNKTKETKSKKNDSFDDILDEDSLDITPHKTKDGVGGKPDSNSNTPGADSFDDMLDEESLDVTPKVGLKMSTPGGESFDDMFDEDSDDNIEAMFQTKNPQTTSGNNMFSPSQGASSILDKDELMDLCDEDDDDF